MRRFYHIYSDRKYQIDYSLAARTAAFDIEGKCWSEEVFSAAGVDVSLMSAPVCAGSIAGILKNYLKVQLDIDYDITVHQDL